MFIYCCCKCLPLCTGAHCYILTVFRSHTVGGLPYEEALTSLCIPPPRVSLDCYTGLQLVFSCVCVCVCVLESRIDLTQVFQYLDNHFANCGIFTKSNFCCNELCLEISIRTSFILIFRFLYTTFRPYKYTYFNVVEEILTPHLNPIFKFMNSLD